MPIRHTDKGWYWGGQGPFETREKASEVAQAAYASGYKKKSIKTFSDFMKEDGGGFSGSVVTTTDAGWYTPTYGRAEPENKKKKGVYVEGHPAQRTISKADDPDSDFKTWEKLINMGPKELEDFIASEDGKKAGTKPGQQSARAIIDMLRTPYKDWTPKQHEWANRQISFISRMKEASGPLRDEKGRPTRKLLALKLWGYNPEKGKNVSKSLEDFNSHLNILKKAESLEKYMNPWNNTNDELHSGGEKDTLYKPPSNEPDIDRILDENEEDDPDYFIQREDFTEEQISDFLDELLEDRNAQ